MPSKLLYLTNSGATRLVFDHRSFRVVTARGPPFSGLIHSSGARVAVSPTYASVPRDDRANAEGFTESGSSVWDRPSPLDSARGDPEPVEGSRATIERLLVNPREMCATSDWLSIHRGCAMGRSSVAAVRFCGTPPAI